LTLGACQVTPEQDRAVVSAIVFHRDTAETFEHKQQKVMKHSGSLWQWKISYRFSTSVFQVGKFPSRLKLRGLRLDMDPKDDERHH